MCYSTDLNVCCKCSARESNVCPKLPEALLQEASRAQKRKAKAAAAAAEREARIAEENAAAGDSARVVEEAALRDMLRPLGLAVRDIPVRAALRCTPTVVMMADRLWWGF